ncbi:hypothetical protein [Polyangium sp. y55x31]|uniref:hypothetical protein n=1 Tax=Polyangium sp. y55x31 TaxID=3042688 RepID=UPI0024830072|nr:hypothetical protein [Polyangium sp. y55x31]MDI1477951.1 hypothetical protein [Polyangium sp. y55x31]
MDPFDTPTPTWEVGRNEVRWEPPDLVRITFRGVTTTADSLRMTEIYDAIDERAGHFYVLVDGREVEALEPGARAAWLDRDKPYPIRHLVSFGATFSMRALVMTIYRAGRILAPSRFTFPLEFKATEQEARARIDELRRAARPSVPPK